MRPILLAISIGAATLTAQKPDFGVKTRLVLVPVTVTAKDGAAIAGLEPGDFTLLENGQPRPIAVDSIGTGVAPIALAVAVQTSGISMAAVEKVRRVGAMIRPLVLGERGRAMLVAFDEQIRVPLEWTSDEGRIAAAFRDLAPSSSGAHMESKLLDAAMEAIGRLAKRETSRRVLILISESRDRSSKTSLEDVYLAAQRSGVTVYAAQYSAFKTAFTQKRPSNTRPAQRDQSGRPNPEYGTASGGPQRDLYDPKLPPPAQRVDLLGALGELGRLGKEKSTDILARETGGMVFSFARLRGLEEAIEKLGADLHGQYVLSFTPADGMAAGYRKLEVRVRRPDVAVRARPGYWAEGPAPPGAPNKTQ